MYENIELPGMHNWCIEEDTGWFVAYSVNVLFKYNRKTKVLSAVSAIPTKKAGSFQNPLCIKYKNKVYCIPQQQSSIWQYDLWSDQWKEIFFCDDKSIDVMACLLGKYNENYYFFSRSLKKIWCLNLETGTVAVFCDMDIQEEMNIYFCMDGILVEDKAYLVFGGTSVYEFDLKSHSQKKHELSGIDDTLYKISYDGSSFWLIGKKKAVYLWKHDKNIVNILTEFPEDLTIYDFTQKTEITDFKNYGNDLFIFGGVKCLNEKTWLIPQAGNKINYYDKRDKKIKFYEIQDEEETAKTLDLSYRHMAVKFFLVYVRESRYLGIYSYKNKCMIEIDTLSMTYRNLEVFWDLDSLSQIMLQEFYEDGNEITYLIYNAKLRMHETDLKNGDIGCVGEQIYMELSK